MTLTGHFLAGVLKLFRGQMMYRKRFNRFSVSKSSAALGYATVAGSLITTLCFGVAYADEPAVSSAPDKKPVYVNVISGKPQPQDDPSLPEAGVLVRPKNSPLPASGVPVAPWPGLATMDVPSVDEYQSAKTFHKMELDDLTGKEGLSWLLPSELDAQRRTDMDDPITCPRQVAAIWFRKSCRSEKDFRKKVSFFPLRTKARRWPIFMAACSAAWIMCMS